MADEEVMGSVSPAPSDHKRKLEDFESEPFEQPPAPAESNGNSQSVADGDGDGDGDGDAATTGVSTGDPDVKRPRIDDNSDGVEASENGHHEDSEEEPMEDITEPSVVTKNTESDEDQEKADEPFDAVNKDSVNDEPFDALNKDSTTDEPLDALNTDSVTENLEESAKMEHQESGVEQQDPTADVASQGCVSGFKEQHASADQPTSRKMEVPNNKVGVLIGKSGDTIRTLQHSSGARIQITRDADADPNSATRPVEIIGSIDSINKAEMLIKEIITEADAGGSPSLIARGFSANSSGIGEQFHMQVPNEKVGVIIGKGGETIKSLQTRSGAHIKLIPQHLPEGDQSKERMVRITGDRKQIEMAKELIKEVMDQPIRSSSTPSGGNNQPNSRPRGYNGPPPRGVNHHSSHSPVYNNYPPRGPTHPSQNQPYSSPNYGNYPPQQPPPKNTYTWDQRPPPNQTGYDYYGGQGGPMAAPPPSQPPVHPHGPPNYGYGQQGPDYGQHGPGGPQGYGGQGYGEPRFDHHGPGQHPYGSQNSQSSTHPGYGQQDQYGKPPPGPYGQTYGQSYGPPRQQQTYPNPSSAPGQQTYPQYGSGPPVTPGGYGQPVSGYGQTGGPGPTAGYGSYPSSQTGYNEQVGPNSGGYGYQGGQDSGYGGGPGYGAPPGPVQSGYSQTGPGPGPVQSGYDQAVPQSGGYGGPQSQVQPGYGQYDSGQMYGGHR